MTPRETVEAAYTAYANRDLDAMLDRFDEDLKVVVHPDNPSTKLCGIFDGRAAFADHLAELARDWDFHAYEPLEILVDGDRVATRVRLELSDRRTGQRFVTEIADFMTVRNGRIVALQEFRDTAVIEAADRH